MFIVTLTNEAGESLVFTHKSARGALNRLGSLIRASSRAGSYYYARNSLGRIAKWITEEQWRAAKLAKTYLIFDTSDGSKISWRAFKVKHNL